MGPLPQLHADRFGWKEMADVVASAWKTLTPEEQKKGAIFAQLYGQAGAIDHYGPALGLPRAVSGQPSRSGSTWDRAGKPRHSCARSQTANRSSPSLERMFEGER